MPEAAPTRLAPCSGFEPEVADRVEAVMPAEGITPGIRVCHDAQSQSHLRVDFVYPNPRPRPLALEVTAIVASEDESGAREAERLSERLTRVAEAEGLGSWVVALQIDRVFRRLEPEILKVIRDAQPTRERLLATGGSIRPGYYTSDELVRLTRKQQASFIVEHMRLKQLGLDSVTPMGANRENYVGVIPGRGAAIRGFDAELQERINAKAGVLGRAPDLERHLAVLVQRWDVSGDPDSMPVPELPSSIDILWVVHRWNLEREQREIWVTRRWPSAWNVYVQD
jgi:hypothetical protein